MNATGTSPHFSSGAATTAALGEVKGPRVGRYWKYRVGDYRIICDLQDGVLLVLVVRVGHRREVYR